MQIIFDWISIMKTTLDELQTFISIADTGSFTAASEQLGQTISGVSRTLSRLEEKLDVSLICRTTRKLYLTDEGRTFLEHVRQIINDLELAEEFIKEQFKECSGLIKIDAASPFVLHSIIPILEEFTECYPMIRFEIHSNDRIIDLLEKKVDVAIRIGPLENSTLYAKYLGSSKLRILASPGYIEQHGMPKSVDELKKHQLLGFNAPRELNRWPLQNEKALYYLVQPHIAASSGETILCLARSGLGIACLADFMTKKDRESGSLVQILELQTIESRQEINAVYYKNIYASKRIALFLQFLKKAFEKTSA